MSTNNTALCCADDSQLLIVDIQKKLGSAMPSKVLNRVVLNTILLSGSAQLLEVPVLLTEQYPTGLGHTDDNILAVLENHQRFEKTAFSATGAPGLMKAVEDNSRKQIIIAGMEAHVCVLQSAISLLQFGYQVFVVEDAICSRRLENYQNALDRMRQANVQVVSAESVAFEWMADSTHAKFKDIQKSIR